jgi:cell wall-associated NlpC family hydrolase
MERRLPTNKSVSYMQHNPPPRGGRQGCDCSSFLRWAMAQAGVDIGTYTKDNWTARGKMPATYTSSSASTPYGRVLRGQGTTPLGGFKVGDLIFYGVSGMGTGTGHIALNMGAGKIVQCSGGRGSNAGLSMDYARRTGWLRYVSVTG